METFETIPKQWGNSMGVTIPKDIVKRERLTSKKKVRIFIVGSKRMDLHEAFGSVKLKKSTQKAMDEIDEGYD